MADTDERTPAVSCSRAVWREVIKAMRTGAIWAPTATQHKWLALADEIEHHTGTKEQPKGGR